MVALTAIVLVVPLALAAPGGASDVDHLRTVIEDALRAGLPGSPIWVFDIPLGRQRWAICGTARPPTSP